MSTDQAGQLLQTVGGWGAAGLTLAGALALLRRRLSRDKNEMAKDRTESAFMDRLLVRYDMAMAEERGAVRSREASAREAATANQAIARLTAQNEHQAREIARLKLEFAAFKRTMVRLHPDLQPFLESGHPPLEKNTL